MQLNVKYWQYLTSTKEAIKYLQSYKSTCSLQCELAVEKTSVENLDQQTGA